MAQAAAGKRNWFAIWVSVAAVVVVALVIGLVVWMNNISSGPGAQPSSSNINTDTGAISFGSGPDVVDTYVDFMCPICNQFEKTEVRRSSSSSPTTRSPHPPRVHPRPCVAGTKFSSRSASAMFAVAEADPANAYAFMEAMFQNQPQESSPGLSDDQIVSIAKARASASRVISRRRSPRAVHQVRPGARSARRRQGDTDAGGERYFRERHLQPADGHRRQPQGLTT
jgi:hypothetical protein